MITKVIANTIEYLSGIILIVFRSFQDSSLFQKMNHKLPNLGDYVIAYDVIGHYVIGHPDMGTESSGFGPIRVENRLVIDGLQ